MASAFLLKFFIPLAEVLYACLINCFIKTPQPYQKFSPPRFFAVLFVLLFELLFEVLYVMELLKSAGSTVEIRRVNCCFPQPQLLKSATPAEIRSPY